MVTELKEAENFQQNRKHQKLLLMASIQRLFDNELNV